MNHLSQKSAVSRVIVASSINQDVAVTVDRFPDPGKTLSGTSFTYGLGGEGVNQAVAAAYSGVPVFFVGVADADSSGQCLRTELVSRGVDVTHLREVDGPSGTALITVNSSGENMIIPDAGANATVTIKPAKASSSPAPVGIAVLQVEIPAEASAKAFAWVHSSDTCILLNLAPARPTDATFMTCVNTPIVNEMEADLTLGMPAPVGPTKAIDVTWALQGLGPRHIMVTLGTDGAVWTSGSEAGHFPTLTLGEAVDTTGTGDACMGALVATMAFNRPFAETVADGIRAGSTAVPMPGAAPSYAAFPRVTRV